LEQLALIGKVAAERIGEYPPHRCAVRNGSFQSDRLPLPAACFFTGRRYET